MALTMNPVHRAMKRFDPNFCLCGTSINMGAHTIAWLFICCDSAILLFVLGSGRILFDDWASVLISICDDLLTLATSIVLLIGIHKKSALLHLPFLFVNSVLFALKAFIVFLSVIVSFESAIRHHASGIHAPNYYNIFFRFNIYNLFYTRPNGVLYMLFFLTLKILVVAFYGYFVTIVYRAYCLLMKEQEDFNHFSNPVNFTSSPQEEGVGDNEAFKKEDP